MTKDEAQQVLEKAIKDVNSLGSLGWKGEVLEKDNTFHAELINRNEAIKIIAATNEDGKVEYSCIMRPISEGDFVHDEETYGAIFVDPNIKELIYFARKTIIGIMIDRDNDSPEYNQNARLYTKSRTIDSLY